MKFKIAALLATFVAATVTWSNHAWATNRQTNQKSDRPNIVLVFADDIGISGISCYGSSTFKTPHIDKLAADGMRFDRGYSTPLCGPSRITLMTGRYPFRSGGIGNKSAEMVDPDVETAFPRLLHEAGYATFATGKWRWLGFRQKQKAWGFDDMVIWEGIGTPDRYWDPNLYVKGKKTSFPGKYGPDVMQDAIFSFIDDVKARDPSQPFFIYYTTCLPHSPFIHTPDSTSSKISKRDKYRDMILYMDKQVGDMRERLKQRGLDENTLIAFVGDNGSVVNFKEKINGRAVLGGKFYLTSGGVRVPWIFYWPKQIKPGQANEHLVDLSDLYTTFLDVAGVKLPSHLKLDSHSFAPLLMGDTYKPRSWVFYQSEGKKGGYAVEDHQWKLDNKGRLLDMSNGLYVEKEVKPSSSDAAKAAYAKLSAVLKQLAPRG